MVNCLFLAETKQMKPKLAETSDRAYVIEESHHII